ncbi:MAG: AAA family ATPase [Chlamydiae bacterium]|nr:AAA family ATPase [Chlamydiota bacterium]
MAKNLLANDTTPQIIFINGPSSSGKTTIAKALQGALDQPYLYLSFDRMIELMPAKINNWNEEPHPVGFSSKISKDANGNIIAQIVIGPFAEKIRQSFKEVSVTLIKSGHFLIIDDVFFQERDYDSWKEALKDYDVFWIGLKTPIAVLEEREKLRQDRTLGSARSQFNLSNNINYDLEIDTSKCSVEESIKLILKSSNFKKDGN